MHAEYDPISFFERNSCFRANIQAFSKTKDFSMVQINFKMSIFGYRSRFLTKFSVLGFSGQGIDCAHCRGMKMLV
jgi:hypothetical protein